MYTHIDEDKSCKKELITCIKHEETYRKLKNNIWSIVFIFLVYPYIKRGFLPNENERNPSTQLPDWCY